MQFNKAIPVKELAQRFNLKIVGDENQLAKGINEIHKVEKGDITFVDVEKYYEKSLTSEATIILINKETNCPEGKTLLICENPFQIYNQIVLEHRPIQKITATIDPSAFIHESAIIEPGVVIGSSVVIGAESLIQANTVICEHTVIGNRVTIQPNCIIGSDAFYYKKTKEGFIKWRSCGRVIIHDDVEIGSGTTINKGVSGDTIIGQGTKLDCQIHIGHGVTVGKNCLFAAQVGIGGKTNIGNNVVLYGQVGIAQNLTIGDNVVVLAASGVSKNLSAGKTYFGAPCEEVSIKYRELAATRQLPDLLKKMR